MYPDAESGTNATKETQIDIKTDLPSMNEAETEDLKGGGALDSQNNAAPGEIEGEDTEKTGAKQPDAMGAGG